MIFWAPTQCHALYVSFKSLHIILQFCAAKPSYLHFSREGKWGSLMTGNFPKIKRLISGRAKSRAGTPYASPFYFLKINSGLPDEVSHFLFCTNLDGICVPISVPIMWYLSISFASLQEDEFLEGKMQISLSITAFRGSGICSLRVSRMPTVCCELS